MLTSSDCFALVGTAAPLMPVKHIRVERAFRYEGTRREIGEVFEVSAPFAAELVAARKACVVPPPVVVKEPPKVDEDDAKPTKAKTNARK